MNIKNGLICVSIIAILTLCTINVTVASPAKYSTDVRNGRVTNMRGMLQTNLFIVLNDPHGNSPGAEVCNVKAGATVWLFGRLIGGTGAEAEVFPYYIPNATIYIEFSSDQKTWSMGSSTTTSSGAPSDEGIPGMFGPITITQNNPGIFYYRAIYDGTNGPDSYTTPAVSNVVTLTTY